MKLHFDWPTWLSRVTLFGLLICFSLVSWRAYQNSRANNFQLDYLHHQYIHSQYSLETSEYFGAMDDDLLYLYSGIMLTYGADPTEINPEMPPLGKYLIGWSWRLSGTYFWIQWFWLWLLTGASWQFTRILTKSNTASYLAGILLVTEPLVVEQTSRSLLDLPLACAVLVCLICLNQLVRTQSPGRVWKYLLGVSIGLAASIKLPLTAGLIWLVSVLWMVARFKRKSIKHLIAISLTASIVYILSYGQYWWLSRGDLFGFILHLVEVIRLYRSYLPEYPWLEIWRILVLGRWQTWWDGSPIIPVESWRLTWLLGSFAWMYYLFKSKLGKHSSLTPGIAFVGLYLLSNSIHLVFPRYVLLVLPLYNAYIMAGLLEVIKKSRKLYAKR